MFTSTFGLESDVKLIRKINEGNPSMRLAFVGPHGHIKPEETLNASEDIDFVTRGEFDHSVVDYAHEIDVLASVQRLDRKSTRLNSSHQIISYAVFCLKKKINVTNRWNALANS